MDITLALIAGATISFAFGYVFAAQRADDRAKEVEQDTIDLLEEIACNRNRILTEAMRHSYNIGYRDATNGAHNAMEGK